MSAAASSSKAAETTVKVAEPLKEDDSQPALGVLEEDDEFEEFAVAGTYRSFYISCLDTQVRDFIRRLG